MNSLLIVIRGGCIEHISSTVELDLTVVDLDSYNVGEEYLINEYLPADTPEELMLMFLKIFQYERND